MLNPGGRFTGAKLARLMRTMGSDSPVASSDSFRSKFQGATLADDVIAKPTTPVVLQRLLMEFGLGSVRRHAEAADVSGGQSAAVVGINRALFPPTQDGTSTRPL